MMLVVSRVSLLLTLHTRWAILFSNIKLTAKGLCKEFVLQKSEITMEVGGPGLTLNFFGKSFQNNPKPVLIFWSSIPCVFRLYIHC